MMKELFRYNFKKTNKLALSSTVLVELKLNKAFFIERCYHTSLVQCNFAEQPSLSINRFPAAIHRALFKYIFLVLLYTCLFNLAFAQQQTYSITVTTNAMSPAIADIYRYISSGRAMSVFTNDSAVTIPAAPI